MAPKLSITGLIAAPLLGLEVHLENEDSKAVSVGDAVRKATDAVLESVGTAAKTIREEVDKAWEAVSADDPEEDAEEDVTEDSDESPASENSSNEAILEELKAHEENSVPTIEVKSADSAQV